MFRPRLNLKNKQAGKSLVLLILEKEYRKMKVSTGISVDPVYWNPKTQFLRESRESGDYRSINRALQEILDRAKDAFEFYEVQQIDPSLEQIKEKYLALKTEPKVAKSPVLFWQYFDEFVAYQKNEIKSRTLVDYDKSLRKHLLECEKITNITLSFNALKNNGGFVQEFEKYLKYTALNAKGGVGFMINSIGKQNKNIKAFLNWCFKRNYCVPFDTSHIKKLEEDVENIFLTESEIEALLNLVLDNIELEKVRDVFIIACETGLRYSDYRRFKPEHFFGNYAIINQTKTNARVKIPISSRLRKVLEKYNYAPPNFSENHLTEFNSKIRRVCALAGLVEPILMIKKEQGKTVEYFSKKYELVSSHTGRRSFCTNWFLKKTVPVKAIMAISGHKTEKSFMKYLKLNDEE